MAITTDSVLNALKAGNYTLTTLTTERFFKTQQPEKRRRYPSVELLETPLSNTATQENINYVRKFDVRIFLGLRGGATTGQQDEIGDLETLESEILSVLESTNLGEHKVITEEKTWNREYTNEGIRPYILSTLSITIRQITGISDTPDGILIFDNSNSIGDTLPGGNYTYTHAFNTDIDDGYRHIEEYSNADANPKDYTGGFSGTMITHIKVKANDLGATTDKLNELRKPQANGELPTIGFIYRDKSAETPSTNQIQEVIKCSVSRVTRMYRTNENAVFRLMCNLLEPSTIT